MDIASGLPNRGKTYLTGPNRTADTTSTTSKGIAGLVKVFADLDYSSNPALTRSQNTVTCILVRNSSGVALLPKRAVTWKVGARGKEVDGYARFCPDRAIAGIVDEWLPAAGVPNNDYFWLTVKGPTLATTALEGDGTNVIEVDDWLVNSTAANSTATTASGRVVPAILVAGVTTNITFANSAQLYKFARAMSAKTTGNTLANILVNVQLY